MAPSMKFEATIKCAELTAFLERNRMRGRRVVGRPHRAAMRLLKNRMHTLEERLSQVQVRS
jgi:hypothetical protein